MRFLSLNTSRWRLRLRTALAQKRAPCRAPTKPQVKTSCPGREQERASSCPTLTNQHQAGSPCPRAGEHPALSSCPWGHVVAMRFGACQQLLQHPTAQRWLIPSCHWGTEEFCPPTPIPWGHPHPRMGLWYLSGRGWGQPSVAAWWLWLRLACGWCCGRCRRSPPGGWRCSAGW